jgi:hypothetical protein
VSLQRTQVEDELQQIQRDTTSHKSRSLWTLSDDRQLLAQYWQDIPKSEISVQKFYAKSAARNRLNYIKLEINDTSYNAHQHVRRRVEFTRENAELYVDALRKCLLHIDTLPEAQWRPPRLPHPAAPSAPPLPPKPPCNHPRHVELWQRGLLPCCGSPRKETAATVPPVDVAAVAASVTAATATAATATAATADATPAVDVSSTDDVNAPTVTTPIRPATTTATVTPQKRKAWTAHEKDQIIQFSHVANTSTTPIKLRAQQLPGRSTAEIRLARNRLKAKHPSTIAVGGFKSRALVLQARSLVRHPRDGCKQQSWRTLFVQKQARAERVAARRFAKGLQLFHTPFPHLRCNSTLPTQHLPYDGWLYLEDPSDSDLDLIGQGRLLPRAPLPTDAVVDWISCRVRMPIEWAVTLAPQCFLLLEGHLPAATYALADVRADTTIDTIANDIKGWLSARKELSVVDFSNTDVQLHILTSDGGTVPLPPEWTAQRADLYNSRGRMIATRLPRAPDMNDLARQRLHARQAAYNNRPDAPEHTAMLNNLLGERGNPAPANSNLPGGRDYAHLETHLLAITAKCADPHFEPVRQHKCYAALCWNHPIMTIIQ